MAITRSQQAKQMLQDGGMLVQPGFGGTRQGYRSEQAQITPGLPAAIQPMQTMDLNRIAYRFMADGGFLDDEVDERQAYGLGSIVRKITRPIKKVVKGVTKTVKKVAKSPVGRLALAVAAPYALGPAMAPYMASLSAAQQAALISGATTGLTQLASGEDLDFKDIALSAALSGGISKLTTPAVGVDGKAFNAGRTSQGLDPSTVAGRARVASDAASRPFIEASEVAIPTKPSIIPDRGMGQITSRPFIEASEVAIPTKPSILPQPKPSIIPDRGMGQIFERAAPKDRGILQAAKDAFTNVKDSKITDILLRNQKGEFSPLKGILLASTLAGAAAKKEQEPDEFTEMDRGPSLDIEGITRRPFDTLRPRFAGSIFDFYDTAAADGGRIGYDEAGAVLSKKQMKELAKSPLYKGFKKMFSVDPELAKGNEAYAEKFDIFKQIYNQGFQKGGKAEPVAKKVMPLLDMGGMEKDYREEGGFVPIGRMEKADDVPARLSKNEFVFTADAVRNAGDGDVDKGAEVMYNMMKNLEAGGDVSEESQGLQGARRMFQTSQRLEEVL